MMMMIRVDFDVFSLYFDIKIELMKFEVILIAYLLSQLIHFTYENFKWENVCETSSLSLVCVSS